MAITSSDSGLYTNVKEDAELKINPQNAKQFNVETPTASGNAANDYLKQVEVGNQQNADALARQMNNNSAMTNAQIAQAGLGAQGAGAAMAQNTAQQNAQLAADEQQQALQNTLQGQITSEEMFMQEQERLNKQRDNDVSEWNRLVANGQFDEADKLSQEKGLGLSTSEKRWDRQDTFMQSEIKRLQAAIDDAEEKQINVAEWEKLNAELSFYEDLQKEINDARANGVDFFAVVSDTMRWDSDSFKSSRVWTDAESKTFWVVSGQIAALANDKSVDLNNIMENYFKKIGYNDIGDFFAKATTNQIEEFGNVIGMLLYGRDAKGNLSDWSKEQIAMITDGNVLSNETLIGLGADYVQKSDESVMIAKEQEKAGLSEEQNPLLGYMIGDTWVSNNIITYAQNQIKTINEKFTESAGNNDKKDSWKSDFNAARDALESFYNELNKTKEGHALLSYLGITGGISYDDKLDSTDARRKRQSENAANKVFGWLNEFEKLFIADAVKKPAGTGGGGTGDGTGGGGTGDGTGGGGTTKTPEELEAEMMEQTKPYGLQLNANGEWVDGIGNIYGWNGTNWGITRMSS